MASESCRHLYQILVLLIVYVAGCAAREFPTAVEAPIGLVWTKYFAIFGGKGKGHTNNKLWAFDLESTEITEKRWYEVESHPTPAKRWKACAVTDHAKENMYILFGSDKEGSKNFYNDIWKFNFESATWTEVEVNGIPVARRSHACTLVIDPSGEESILVYGGRTVQNLPVYDTERFVISTKKWELVRRSHGSTPSPGPRIGHVMVPMKNDDGTTNAVYLHGGENLHDTMGGLWKFVVSTQSWEAISPLMCLIEENEGPRLCRMDERTLGRTQHVAVSPVHGTILVHGGRSSFASPQVIYGDVWRYDIYENVWVRVLVESSLYPANRYAHAGTQYGAGILMFGGKDSSSAHHNDIWYFDYEADEWTLIAEELVEDDSVFWDIVIAADVILAFVFILFMVWRHHDNKTRLKASYNFLDNSWI